MLQYQTRNQNTLQEKQMKHHKLLVIDSISSIKYKHNSHIKTQFKHFPLFPNRGKLIVSLQRGISTVDAKGR